MNRDVSSDSDSGDEFDHDYESNEDESSCLDYFTADENDDDVDDDDDYSDDEDDESNDKDVDDLQRCIDDIQPRLQLKQAKLKSLREEVKNWDSEKERLRLLRRFGRAIIGEIDTLSVKPSLRDVFEQDEIERLLFDTVKCLIGNDESSRNYIAGVRFVKYAARTSYRIEPRYVAGTGSYSRRATPIHRLIGCSDRLYDHRVVDDLFYIYSNYSVNYVDDAESDGLTHLHVACEFGLETYVGYYLKRRPADANCVWRRTGDAPLHMALARDRKRAIEKLLKSDADLSQANRDGATALHLFSQKLYDEELKQLFESILDNRGRPIKVNAQDKLGNTPLHLTSAYGHPHLIRQLLERGADPNLANAEGQTALHIICKRERYCDDDLVETLFRICAGLGRQLRVDAQDHRGNAPLHLALEYGNERVIESLLRHGAYPNLPNEAGETPLHVIGSRSDCSDDFVELFFELSRRKHRLVEENLRDDRGNTPLHLALCYGKRKAAVLLLRRGGYAYLANGEGLSPLHLICANGYDDDLLKVFLKICDELQMKTNLPVRVDPRDRDGNTPLHWALMYDDVSGAKKVTQLLLDRGADPSAANNDGSTPMHFICRTYRHNDLLEMFLMIVEEKNQLLHIDAKDKWGDTPLHLALRCRNTSEAKLLLIRGADPTAVDSQGSTPLHSICGSEYDRRDVAELMFEVCPRICNRTLEVDARDRDGNVALNLALEKGNMDIAELLLRRGADPSLANPEGLTALHAICRERRYLDLLGIFDRSIVRLVQANPRDKLGNTPLHLAVLNANDVAAEWLLRNGAGPNPANEAGDTPLHVICKTEQCHAGGLAQMFFRVNRQVGREVLLDVRNERGDAPLHLALRHENEEVAELLLKRGADSSQPDSEGSYPLHSICRRFHGEGLMKLLFEIDRTVKVDVQDKNGNTPLHLAMFYEKTTMVELLLRKGADPSVANAEGQTALHIASTRKHCDDELAKILFEICGEIGREVPIDAPDSKGRTALHLALERKRRPLLRYLLRQGADPNAATADGTRPLHVVCRVDDVVLAKILIEISGTKGRKRLDVDAQDGKGDTALHVAIRRERKKMILLLLRRKKAALHLANEEGSTVLHLVCRKYLCETALLEYLLDSGEQRERPLPIDVRDKSRQNTALHYALALDHREAAVLLISKGADPNLPNVEGWTALHDLCQRYHDDELLDDFLAIANTNEARRGSGQWPAVNARDKLGRTPLHLVPDYGHANFVKWMLERGADPSQVDAEGLTAVNVVCKRYDSERDSTDEYRSLEVDARDATTGDTRLHAALRQGNEKVAELLLIYGADPNLANNLGSTPLHVIAEREISSELGSMFFQLCYERRVQVRMDSRDGKGNTPLHLALRFGRHMMQDNVAQELLIYGADTNLANDEGATALHAICQRDRDEADFANGFFDLCAETRRPVRIDVPDGMGRTALHWAVFNGHRRLTETLLRRGADPNLADSEGQTALHIGCRTDSVGERVASFFRICGSIERTVRVDARDAKGNTPLHLALQAGNDRLVEMLLVERDASPNLANEAGETPLHVICQTYSDDGLIDDFFRICHNKRRPVRVNARDSQGRTPLQWAVANLLPSAIDRLLKQGADLSSFVFPTEDYFGKRFEPGRHGPELKMAMVAHALVVVERLEKQGYKLSRDDDLVVVKFFATHELCQRPRPDRLARARANHHTLNKIQVKKNASLHQLIACRTPREAKAKLRLTAEDYYEFVRLKKLTQVLKFWRDTCALHLCELMAGEFCWRGVMDAFMELTHFRLPIECGEMIIDDTFESADLCNICLAAAPDSPRNAAA